MKKTALLIFSFLFGFTLTVNAQSKLEGYQKQIPKYTEWLQSNNLNNFLSVFAVDSVGETTFQLYLKFETRFDSVPLYWRSIDKKLHAERSYGLDSLLYFAGVNIFKIPPPQFNIIIYETYENQPQDTVGLFYDAEKRSIESYISFGGHRGQEINKTIAIGQKASSAKSVKLANFDHTKKETYTKILKILKTHYYPNIEGDKKSNFIVLQDEDADQLHLKITNVRRQIINKNENPWMVEMANYFWDLNIDWNRLEGIELKINLTQKNKTEATLNVWVDARYGSGIWGVDNWNNVQNFEPEYESEVRNYAAKVATLIKDKLK